MGKIRIHQEADCKLMTAKDFLIEKLGANADLGRFSDEALSTKMRIFEEGSDSSPRLFESQVLPNTTAAVHTHEEDKIMYILEGEMQLGNRSLKRGSTIFIEAKTPYGFKTGPEGVKFLNFRPHKC
jgi:hypothetical protein